MRVAGTFLDNVSLDAALVKGSVRFAVHNRTCTLDEFNQCRVF
jgi:hypothetical protein